MQKLDREIARLLSLKNKIEQYKQLIADMQAKTSDGNTESLEFVSEVVTFAEQRVAILGNCEEISQNPEKNTQVFQENADNKNVVEGLVRDSEPLSDSEPTDPLKFAQKYRHLDNKMVKIVTKMGDVKAVVRGMVAPNLIVETETGHTIKVRPSEIVI